MQATYISEEELKTFRVVLPFVCLALVNAIVLCGNILVIVAVCTSAKLRGSVTNNFIASLAASDLLLGMFVLPFSSTEEVLQGWIFGNVWCSVWLAVDVWLSTASILNLCAISLDRYIAISRSLKYHCLMSPRRSKMLIAFVWVFSFVICFPPLIGWNKDRKSMVVQTEDKELDTWTSYEHIPNNITLSPYKNTSGNSDRVIVLSECALTSDPGYVIYSSVGSFYLPMVVMMFFYWRIYKIAARTTKALKKGVVTTKAGGGLHQTAGDNEPVTLRVHRGGGGSIKIPNKQLNENVMLNRDTSHRREHHHPITIRRSPKNERQFPNLVNYKPNMNSKFRFMTHSGTQRRNYLRPHNMYAEPTCGLDEGHHSLLMKIGRKNVKSQLKRLNKETRAAKTVAIIIGCFILCWFPFFTVYLLGAFCVDCTPKSVFSVFFWLGYCNSAVNPFVYAYFSRDFRYAFKRLICLHCTGIKYSQRRSFPRSVKIPMTSRYSDSDSDPKEHL